MAAATGYSLTGPTSVNVGAASANYTATLTPAGGTVASPVTITPSDAGQGGTFTPATVQLTTGAPSATFTYTPLTTGLKTVSSTNNGALTDPAALTLGVLSAARFTTTCVANFGKAYTGKAATVGYTVYDPTGAVLLPRTAGAATEVGAGTGIYVARITFDGTWNGILVWDEPTIPSNVVEPFDFSTAIALVSGAAALGYTRMRGVPLFTYLANDGHSYTTDSNGYTFVLNLNVGYMQSQGLVTG